MLQHRITELEDELALKRSLAESVRSKYMPGDDKDAQYWKSKYERVVTLIERQQDADKMRDFGGSPTAAGQSSPATLGLPVNPDDSTR